MAAHEESLTPVRFLYDQKVPMRDGALLSADVFMPRAGSPFPTIVQRTPYESSAGRFIAWGIYWASRGYAAVTQDCRGKYESGEGFYPWVTDGNDTVDTLYWIANQRWSDGKIGTWGRSYGGAYQWLAAPLGSPRLACMAPHVIHDDFFLDGHHQGGAFQLTLTLTAAICFTTNMAVLQENSPAIFNNSRFIRQLPLIDMDIAAIGRKMPMWRDWVEHENYDDYWKPLSTLDKYEKITVPIFSQCGWYDAYPGSTLRQWKAMTERGGSALARKSQKAMIGPWSHAIPDGTRLGEIDFGASSFVDVAKVEERWYDHWLKGIDTGFMEEPPLRLFIMGSNTWRNEHEWPLARTQFTPYYLHSGGRANSSVGDGTLTPDEPGNEPPDRYDYDPDHPVPSIGGNNSTATWTEKAEEPIIPGPVDQRPIERRDDVLVYTGPPLERDLEVTGPLEVVLYAASSARDTDFTAKLIDVFPNGYAMNIAEGILRGRFRKSFSEPDFLQPGEVDEFRIRLVPTANVFKKGHRLRLDISSSNFPRFDRNLNSGEPLATGTRIVIAHQTVLHTSQYPSHILLPIIPD